MLKKFYNYFSSIKEELTEEDIKKIDALFAGLSFERQDGINKYMMGICHQSDAVGKKASQDIESLKKKFRRLLKPKKIKTIYDYFKNIKDELTEEDIKKIDDLFKELPLERQEGINEYLMGKYHQSDIKGRKALKDIRTLQLKFKKTFEPKKIKTIYDYFKNIKDELTEEDIKKIDNLFKELPLDRQEGINGYLMGKYDQSDSIGLKANQDIIYLIKSFKYPKRERTFYNYFKKFVGELTEEDIAKIDDMFNGLSYDRQEGIKRYIAGEYHFKDSIGNRAARDLQILQIKFKTFKKLNKSKTIYDYFKSIKEELTEEDIKKINELFAGLSLEHQKIINEYIAGKYTRGDARGRRALQYIQLLKNQFENKKVKNLYDYFKKIKRLTDRDKKYIDKLFFSLPLINQQKIREYFKEDFNISNNSIFEINWMLEQFLTQEYLYGYFRCVKEDLTDEDKDLIDKLFLNSSINAQEKIKEYIIRKRKDNNFLDKEAINEINILRNQFKDVQVDILYNVLWNYFNITTEEDIKIMKYLFKELPLDNQKGIFNYIQNKYKKVCFEVRRARYDLDLLKNKFIITKKMMLEKKLQLLKVLKEMLKQETNTQERYIRRK